MMMTIVNRIKIATTSRNKNNQQEQQQGHLKYGNNDIVILEHSNEIAMRLRGKACGCTAAIGGGWWPGQATCP